MFGWYCRATNIVCDKPMPVPRVVTDINARSDCISASLSRVLLSSTLTKSFSLILSWSAAISSKKEQNVNETHYQCTMLGSVKSQIQCCYRKSFKFSIEESIIISEVQSWNLKHYYSHSVLYTIKKYTYYNSIDLYIRALRSPTYTRLSNIPKTSENFLNFKNNSQNPKTS